ncbi:insecticidal delta-endotoxin Cry8Ea1 family protein [Brevibacillus laterosporus]|uniref:Insecticidal delta-endotoxin Cry8Ea1 family protein n=1 Tax=Brevibacillus laterosporus TaxID=1465 RepID=A0AAP3DKP0_BRELA|nr:insecticidal delta-endotoxin Cry8Ea1 family protein [Brevibacillus laterosporus]MCR8981625.1 insecticidal delta-endotoxin Cry8Ea1 family protein [Brevibacillus laterosporus]MCZ0808780.1 insecticidal delta-endotoxin Cry8Ea1 family protein [Brevibacillus laterosporus]MCZ0827247.1 insecticidal delta-endotoxin Cry8Ea1 family protein [Brevibacillus laterosporus]MCZ0851003.1 insecticidal delta-endotoxin Cry8Ea1 family protein [Brevibacillus laterosporus]
MNNNFDGNNLTPINGDYISDNVVTHDCTPCNYSIPFNAMRKDPFRRKTIQEITNDWTEWKENSPSLFTPAIVGIVSTFLLEALKKEAKRRLLQYLQSLIFPNSTTQLMQEILRATEQFVREQLDNLTYNRVTAELVGLEENIRTFNNQVDDFLENRSGVQPTAIVDAVNTMQQLFVNRMPQFQLREYEVLLLPLFAQAATLHLTFIRDVIIHADEWNIPAAQLQTYKRYLKEYVAKYSNYALKTYDNEFKARFYPKETLGNMLNFKTFMTINVLDFVSIWSLLKYENLFISTSANLYNIGNNTVDEGTLSIIFWPVFNSYIQTHSNYLLSGITSSGIKLFFRNPIFGRYRQDSLLFMRATYVGGKQGPYIGRGTPTQQVRDIPSNLERADVPEGFETFNFNCSLQNPLEAPFYASQFEEITGSGTIAGYGGYVRRDGLRSSERTCLTESGSTNWINYPGYYITNISATIQSNVLSLFPLYFGENRVISGDGIDKLIAVYNRKSNIAGTSSNGTIIHLAPTDGTGFTVSPLHPTSVSTPSYSLISEKYGNSGDSLQIISSNLLTITFTIEGSNQYRYNLYLRVAGSGELTATIGSSTGTLTVNTNTDNEGITDNGATFKDVLILQNVILSTRTTVQIQVRNASDFNLMNLIFLSPDDVPFY